MKALHRTPRLFDLRDWSLETTDKFTKLVEAAMLDAAAEVLQIAMEHEDTHAFFAAEFGDHDGYGGRAPDDPLTVYFSVALGSGDNTPDPIFTTSLGEMLENTLRACEEDTSFSPGLTRIRDGLRALADRIDAALSEGKRNRGNLVREE